MGTYQKKKYFLMGFPRFLILIFMCDIYPSWTAPWIAKILNLIFAATITTELNLWIFCEDEYVSLADL